MGFPFHEAEKGNQAIVQIQHSGICGFVMVSVRLGVKANTKIGRYHDG